MANVQAIAIAPKFLIESLVMILIAVVALVILGGSTDVQDAIPELGLIGIGAQRLLPILQQSYSSWTSIKGYSESLTDVMKLLEMKANRSSIPDVALQFHSAIRFSEVSFRYTNDEPYVLRGVTFEVKKGDKVGIRGQTGSGKSTLLDILMGLLPVSEGEILIDDHVLGKDDIRSWQNMIAHVPQDVFIADDTVRQNVAFGFEPELIDDSRIQESVSRAQLTETIMALPDKYDSNVGEHGTKISGGQKQRIGIARALYRDLDVLILDESSSALDRVTESKVMDQIVKLDDDVTVFIVSHRDEALIGCTKILEVVNGTVTLSENPFVSE